MLGLVVRNTVFLIDDAAPCFVFLASPSPGSASLLAAVITAAAVIGFCWLTLDSPVVFLHDPQSEPAEPDLTDPDDLL